MDKPIDAGENIESHDVTEDDLEKDYQDFGNNDEKNIPITTNIYAFN